MRIDRIELQNFKKFDEMSIDLPRSTDESRHAGSFHVLIGENGSGKTSVLDSLAVALGVWLTKVPDSSLTGSRRSILPSEKRQIVLEESDRVSVTDAQGDVVVRAHGIIGGTSLTWEQRIKEGSNRVNNSESQQALDLIQNAYNAVKSGEEVTLPVIGYYGAGRTWLTHRDRRKNAKPSETKSRRWNAFYDCLNERIRITDLNRWFETETIAIGSRGGESRPGYEAVKRAVLRSVPDADDLWFDPDRRELIVSINQNPQPLSNLSAGQHTLTALVADIAIKSVTQNNFLVPSHQIDNDSLPRVLAESPGVVLIDELDVHLHPKWQRLIVNLLRSTFPSIQFITTTHSPFIVQSLEEHELINLEGQPIPELGNLNVGQIAEGLMGVERADVSLRYQEMVDVAKSYLNELNQAVNAGPENLTDFEINLAEKIAPYADNPAFQAFLEMKHAAKLGTPPRSEHGVGES